MTGVLDGLRVIDLSWGVSGPIAGMLLADHGASVTRIEPPEGDPFQSVSGYRVWNRGKRSAFLDLESPEGLETFLALAREADVVLESFSPGTTKRLGIDYATLAELNPRLIYCSITGYGASGKHADRPAYDALVAARTGQQWEHRSVVGSTIARLSGGTGYLPGISPPDEDCWVGPAREGPLFGGVPWASMSTAYLATLGISAALRSRETTGLGQHVETSLMQGVLVNTAWSWARVEKPDNPLFLSWFNDPRVPKGIYRAADGRWTHHWPTMPGFILKVSEGDRLEVPATDGDGAARWNTRWAIPIPEEAQRFVDHGQNDAALLLHYNKQLNERVGRFPADEWVKLAAEVGAPVQPVRSPEEALLDAALQEDGCVIEVQDPDHGPVLQVGRLYALSDCPTSPPAPVARPGAHTDEVIAGLWGPREPLAASAPDATRAPSLPPLHGIRVIDLGLAVAGPYCTQTLGELGAEIIKVNTLHEGPWFDISVAMCANRGKRSIALDLKSPEGMEVLRKLVASADVVQHNMRPEAAARLGVDYETLKQIKPDIIYSIIRGFEYGARQGNPGNDQMAAALAGTEWLDGGVDDGGRALWSLSSLGDTGTGLLSAIGIVQALYHRDRTGRGQMIDASLIYTQLLHASMSWIAPDQSVQGQRPSLDGQNFGWSALYRLYKTADGWICIAALTDAHWCSLCKAIGREDLAADARFATGQARRDNDAALWADLEIHFRTRSAVEWLKRLDAEQVPAEISSPDFVTGLFDDEEMIAKGWVTSYVHQKVGRTDVAGKLIDFSRTPAPSMGASPVVGAHTREILAELGYAATDIDAMLATKAAAEQPSV